MLARDYDSVSVHYVDVDAEGVVDLDSLRGAVTDDTALVSVMAVNNETGVREPLDGVASVVHSLPGAKVTHTDAVAAAPWLDLSVVTGSIDMVSLTTNPSNLSRCRSSQCRISRDSVAGAPDASSAG